MAYDDQVKGCWKTCEPVTEWLDEKTCTCVVNTGQNGEDRLISGSEITNVFNQEISAAGC